jgi:hypothetical protein
VKYTLLLPERTYAFGITALKPKASDLMGVITAIRRLGWAIAAIYIYRYKLSEP